MRPWTLAAIGLLAMLAVAAPATAQVFHEPTVQEVRLTGGTSTTLEVQFHNPTTRAYSVLGSAAGNLSAVTTVEPRSLVLGPDGLGAVTVTIDTPDQPPFREAGMTLIFTVVDRASGESFERRTELQLVIEGRHHFVGRFENPLPAPLDQGWGMFAVEAVGFFFLSFVFSSAVRLVVGTLVPEARATTRRRMTKMVQAPIWYLAFVLGVNYSWRLVPASPLVSIMDKLLNSTAIVVAGVLAYRTVIAVLLYYREHLAGRTETKLDDVLIPVLQKLGTTVIVLVATFYTLRVLGVDLSFLVAGGLVMGLVISMAAQDTLSNFFAGIFILADRPFNEGDELQLETGEICRVERIGLRSTRLYHFQNHQHMILPNNELATKRVVNLSYPDQYYRLVVPIHFARDADLAKAEAEIMEAVDAQPEIIREPATQPRLYFRGFGDWSIEAQLRVYIPSSRHRNPVRTALVREIRDRLRSADVPLAIPRHIIHMDGEDEGALGVAGPGSQTP